MYGTRMYAPGELEREQEQAVAAVEFARQRIEKTRSSFAAIEGQVVDLVALPDGYWFGRVALPRTRHPADFIRRLLMEAESSLPDKVEKTEDGVRAASEACAFARQACFRSVKDLVLCRLDEMEFYYAPHEARSHWRDEIQRRKAIARRLPL